MAANGHAQEEAAPAFQEVELGESGDASPTTKGLEEIKKELGQEATAFLNALSFRMGGTDEENKQAILRQRQTSMFESVERAMEKQPTLLKLKKVIRVTLEWKELSYKIVVGKRKKRATRTILSNLTGAVAPGRLLAVMGPTGCGKTSLINALAGRLPVGGVLEGDILVNGLPRGNGFRQITAFVQQDDILFANLTVRETFEFAARMRLPSDISAATKTALVDDIITELGLAKAQNTFIGNAFVRGVSGGERKRCNIGVELLSNPSLIFLDEPTSGLDAFQAQNVMESLWALASNGRTVISSIHQPRSSIYKMFDLLLLLSEGQIMFFGPAHTATQYFANAGFPLPVDFNPADFFLDVVSMDYRSPESEASTRKRINLLADLYPENASTCMAPVDVQECSQEEMRVINTHPSFVNNSFTEFGLLLGRSWKQSSRDKLPIVITLVQTVIIGFVLAGLYSQMPNNQVGISDEIGILFFICIFSAFGAMFGALNTFPVERGVVNRERSSKSYHVLPYYIARFITEMPLRVGQGLLFGCIVYWIVGLNPTAQAFFTFVALLVVEGLAAQGLGVAVSAAAKNEKIALAIAPSVTIILILFGGFYVNKDTIPPALRWIEYLSHLYFAFMGLAINDFRGRDGWTCGDAPPDSPGCLSTGDEVLDRLGFGNNELWQAFLGLLCLTVGYNGLGYVLLRFTKPKYMQLTNSSKKAE